MNAYFKAKYLERRHHNRVAEIYAKRSETDYIWEVPSEILLFRKNHVKPGDYIVDMGCGPSALIRRLIPPKVLDNVNYIGVDISDKMLKFAKKNVPRGRFRVGDMSTIKLPKGKFDVILSLGALHHSIDKEKTVTHWVNLLKSGGVILLREPIYEALKMGEGESPIEEGIKFGEFSRFILRKKLRIMQLTFFNTNAFHLFNRIMIKIGLRSWQKIRVFWYPVVYVDVFLSRFSKYGHIFKPQAFAAILRKT